MPRVSVIMNCRNSATYLRQALDSVYQQTFKDFEIIFWDNQSTDGSGDIALSYGGPLRYFRGEQPLSLGAARNAAIEKTQGEYIAFLDCDDVWLPDKLSEQVKLLEANRELGLVYSDSYMIDGNGNPVGKTWFSTVRPSRGNVFDRLFQVNFAVMPTVVIRKAVLGEIGMFNPHYEIAEEYDLWLRIADRYPVDYVDKPLAKYRIGCGITSRNQERMVDEALRIVDYWLQKKAGPEKAFRRKARQRQAGLHAWLIRYYLGERETRKALRRFPYLARLLPYSLASVPAVVAGLARLMFPRKSAQCKKE